jgi:hypothetical protein
MPRGRMRASGGIAEPHWVQNAAGGVERWQVGQRISPGLGVAMSRALCRASSLRARPARRYPVGPVRRINVIGTSCSGTSTLARVLGARLGLPVIELDALFWGPGWTPVPHETFRARVEAAASSPTETDRWLAGVQRSASASTTAGASASAQKP